MKRFGPALLLALVIAGTSGCSPPQPPGPAPICHFEYSVDVYASPDAGDVNPDYLVKAGSTVSLTGVPASLKVCKNQTTGKITYSTGPPLPDMVWRLLYLPREGLPQDVTGNLQPGQSPPQQSFVAQSGTYRLTVAIDQHPEVTKTITIEVAATDEWVSIGADGRWPGSVGRVQAFAFHPFKPGRMYAATAGGGLYRSDHFGDWWYPLSAHKIVNGMPKAEWRSALNVARVEVLPNGDVVVATGDADSPGFSFPDAPPFYTSTDDGETWTQGGQGCQQPEDAIPSGSVQNMVQNHATGTLYAVVGSSLLRSQSEGRCWQDITPPAQLRSSRSMSDVAVQSMSKHLQGMEAVLYATVNFSGVKSGVPLDSALLVSLNAESGTPTWANAQLANNSGGNLNTPNVSTVERIRLAASSYGAYAVVPVAEGGVKLKVFSAPSTLKQPKGTMPTFAKLPDPNWDCGNQCSSYDLAVATSTLAPAAGAGSDVVIGGQGDLERSLDGGKTWHSLGYTHADHHFLSFEPLSQALWAANDGGLATMELSANGESGAWLLRNYGMATLQFYGASISPSDPKYAITGGGLQDNAVHRRSGGRVWTSLDLCDGLTAQFDAADPVITYTQTQNCGRRVTRYNPAGVNVNVANNPQFILSDPFNAGVMLGINPLGLANPYQLFRATGADKAKAFNWTCADPNPSDQNEFITAVLFGSDLKYYVATRAGAVWRVDPSKLPGNAICMQNDFQNDPVFTHQPAQANGSTTAQVAGIATDPKDAKSMYVTLGRNDEFRVSHIVWNANKNGWDFVGLAQQFPKTTGFPSLPFASSTVLWGFADPIVVDPFEQDAVYVGTESGVFKGSSTPDQPWTQIATVPNTWVLGLYVAQGKLCDAQGVVRAITFGRGILERFFPSGMSPCGGGGGGSGEEAGAAGEPSFPGLPPRFSMVSLGGAMKQATRPGRLASLSIARLGGAGPLERVDRAAVLVRYSYDGGAGSGAKLHLELVSNNEVKRYAQSDPVRLEPGSHVEVITLHYALDNTPIAFDSGALQLDVLDASGRVVTSERRPLVIRWRNPAAFSLTIEAEVLGENGGNEPLTVPVQMLLAPTATARLPATTPASLSFAMGSTVSLEAPEDAQTSLGTARFVGWMAARHPQHDWSRARAVPIDPRQRSISVLLDDETAVIAQYRIVPHP